MELFAILIIIMVVLLGMCQLLIKSIEKGRERAEKELGKEMADKIYNEAFDKVKFGKGYGIKCPNCGQVNVTFISTTSRAVSVGTVGLVSNKIGKTYKCPKCKYMW